MIILRRVISGARHRLKAQLQKKPLPDSAAALLGARNGPKKVVIFIGHHKVGSTSLQDFLARNAPALAQSGVLYPFVDFQGLSYMAATGLGRVAVKGSLAINIREPHNALAFRMLATAKSGSVPGYHAKLPSLPQMQQAIEQQIRFFEPHTVILAAEVFANFAPNAPEMIPRLANMFPDSEITLVATLRRIDQYLASWHGQRLKFGHDLRRLSQDGLKDHLGSIHFDYQKMLEGWITALPKAKVILRDYADVRQAGGSVVDFIAQTGLTLPQGLAPERHENDSLHRGIYEMVRQGNHRLERKDASLLRRTLRDISPDLDLPVSAKVEMFGPDVRAELATRFEPIAAYLAQMSERPDGFFAKPEAVTHVLPHPEIEVAAAAHRQTLALWPRSGAAAPLRSFLNDFRFEGPTS